MKSLLSRDIPPRAALAVVALVLFASVVTGREAPAPVAATAARPKAAGAAAESGAELDVEKLRRARKEETVVNLFAPAAVAPPGVVKSESGPPPAPVAPPLPFTYLGKIVDGGSLTVFVARGDEHYIVEAGQAVAGQYKVEQVTADAVTFIYLPLSTRQLLALPASN